MALSAVIVLAAALRFYAIGDQSFWFDESYTVDLVGRSFCDMLAAIPRTESTPPLYYVLAWPWARVFGDGEAGLRSLSAVIGTGAVPVAWAAARAFFADVPRAPLVAALLVAVNPWFVWYSQEARSYSLLVLTATLSLWALARALNEPTPRRLALWAGAAALALITHYFAGFLVVAEAAWLVFAVRTRAALLASGAVALAGVALMPLALHQRASQTTSFIAQLDLGTRVADLPKKLVTGELGTFIPLIGPVAGVVAVAAIAYGLWRARRVTAGLVWLAAFGIGVPLLLALLGADYLLPRNVIGVYPALVLAMAGGFALAGRAGLAGLAVVPIVAVTVNIEVTRDDRLQRTDWRRAAAALGPARPQAVVVVPEWDAKPLKLYAGRVPVLPASGAPASEIVLLGEGQPPRFAVPPPPPGFTLAEARRTASYLLVRYVSAQPVPVTPAALAALGLGSKPPAFLIRK